DIFCYSSKGAGFDVYKNISTSATGLQFQKIVTQQLSAFYPDAPPTVPCSAGKPCNLYVSPVDIPAFSDIDNDGDIDVITFDINGSNMQYHKNMSMEKFNNCDSLVFQVANFCWGYATENSLNNTYTLFDTCINNVVNPQISIPTETSRQRHSGSCELCIDLDADGDKEFIAGDISYNNLTMLTNGGTPSSASFTKIDTGFPANNGNTLPVDLTIFPCGFYIDVDGDAVKDFVVSPNVANSCENFNSIVYYKNTGANNFPSFQHKQNNFLQDQMIDLGEGAYPVFFDYNHDGLVDLFVGNYGYYDPTLFKSEIALFKNTGTPTTPQYELVTRNYGNLNTAQLLSMAPTFGDLDGDGDADLIVGDYAGNLYYYENTAAANSEPQYVLSQPFLKNSKNRIIDVGDFAAPQLFDVDNDGKNDLIIGARNGKISYYHNSGSTTLAVFDSVTNFWGGVYVNTPGFFQLYAQPFLFRDKGITKLLVGSLDGYLHFYDHIDNNLNGTFQLIDSAYQRVYQGTRSAPAVADINNDGFQDLVVGNYQGGISFYKGVATDPVGVDEHDYLIHFNFELFPNPSNDNVTIRINNQQNKTYLVEVYTVLGQLLSSHSISNNSLTLDTQNLNAGVYLYKVYELDRNNSIVTGALTKRLIVQHE
ncbi:MAG TPA: FG-GAP-like repeat-containing protein, partial [Bacteroidia bacterium]|nr:FG-GAP-like repeat-containing protein [Bacteroidia bacterium]